MRARPRIGPTRAAARTSGGPSAEHNYNAGLMLHYFLTGDRASRDAAIGLARWVLDMDDGRRTPFRWLAGGADGPGERHRFDRRTTAPAGARPIPSWRA